MTKLLALALWCARPAGATEPPPELVTDRPDRTESTPLVTPGRVQVEAGWTHASDSMGPATVSSDAVPETLLRIGLVADRLELRVIHDGWGAERAAPGGSLGSGLNDGAVGVKLGLLKERGLLPDLSLNLHTSVPLGAAARTSGRFEPDGRLLCSHSLPRECAISANLGAAGRASPVVQYTASLGFPLPAPCGGFLEVFGDIPANGRAAAHSLDGGATWGVRPNLQLDLAAGLGLTGAAEDWFAGLGVSYRYPD